VPTPKLSAPAPHVRLDTRNIVLTPPTGSYSPSLLFGTGISAHYRSILLLMSSKFRSEEEQTKKGSNFHTAKLASATSI
jgi:hypothetical protein